MAKSTYTNQPHQQLPDLLARRLCELRDLRVGANHLFTAALITVRDADWGIPSIAVAVNMEAITVSRRIIRGRRHPKVVQAIATLGLHVPEPPLPADAHPRRFSLHVPKHIGAHLRELRERSSRRRLGVDDDHVALAAEHLAADIEALAQRYSLTQIAKAAGVTCPGLLAWIRRRNIDVARTAA